MPAGTDIEHCNAVVWMLDQSAVDEAMNQGHPGRFEAWVGYMRADQIKAADRLFDQ